jgi:hypothetical protein
MPMPRSACQPALLVPRVLQSGARTGFFWVWLQLCKLAADLCGCMLSLFVLCLDRLCAGFLWPCWQATPSVMWPCLSLGGDQLYSHVSRAVGSDELRAAWCLELP